MYTQIQYTCEIEKSIQVVFPAALGKIAKLNDVYYAVEINSVAVFIFFILNCQ